MHPGTASLVLHNSASDTCTDATVLRYTVWIVRVAVVVVRIRLRFASLVKAVAIEGP